LTEDIKHFYNFKEDLTYQDGVVFRGEQIIIPKSLRSKILEKLHIGHLGINGTIKRARESIHWPGIARDIKNKI